MDNSIKITCCGLLLLILHYQISMGQEFNYTDSIRKLSSIKSDSDYQVLAGKIATAFAKEKKESACKNFLQQQMKARHTEPVKFQYAFLYYARMYYQLKKYDVSVSLVDSALRNHTQFVPEITAKLHRLKAQYHYRKQDFAASLLAFKSALEVLKITNDTQQSDDVLAAISSCYYEMDDLPNALNYAQQAESISKQTGDLESRSRILNTIGSINKELGNFEEAIKNYDACVASATQTDDYEGMILCTSGKATIQRQKGNYYEAWKILQEALGYAEQYGVKHLIAGVKVNLANLKSDENKLAEAKALYLDALNLANETGDRKNSSLINANIGFLLTDEKKYNESVSYLQTALPIAEEIDDLTLVKEIHGGLYDNYKAMNQLAKALHEHELYAQCSDSLMNDDKAREIANLKTQYAVAEKENELNEKAEKEKLITATEIKRQKLMKNFSIAGGFLFLLLAGFIFQRYRERHKTSLLLAEKNKQIETAYNQLKDTQEELVQTEKQREAQGIRVRIARDIHDDIGSGLTKITMLSDVLKKKSVQHEVADSLSKITNYSKEVSSSLSEIVWAINPVNDNVASLISYMKSTANNLLDDSGINYKLKFPQVEINTAVNPEIKRNIYLVMKEAINNSLKYSSAKNIDVTFIVSTNSFELIIADDGVGFDINNNNGDHHIGGNGLINMRNRMNQHENSLEVSSAAGSGCKIIATGKLS